MRTNIGSNSEFRTATSIPWLMQYMERSLGERSAQNAEQFCTVPLCHYFHVILSLTLSGGSFSCCRYLSARSQA